MASVSNRLFRRKSSEAELGEIFKTDQSANDQQNMDDDQDGLDGLLSGRTVERLSTKHPHAPRRTLSAPSPIRLDLNANEQTGLTEDDRLANLEKKVSTQQDEITILKSALANILRRLGTVEENAKRPKGRMMPSIPTSSTASQPSALARPSRHSVSHGPKLEEESGQDSLGYNINMVKGLLKSMRSKSPLPRGISTTTLTNVNQSSVTSATVSSSSSVDSATVIQTNAIHTHNQPSSAHMTTTDDNQIKDANTVISTVQETIDDQKLEMFGAEEITTTSTITTDDTTSPTVTRPSDLALASNPSAHARKLSNGSPLTSPTSDVPSSSDDSTTASKHARKLSGEKKRAFGSGIPITSSTMDVDSSDPISPTREDTRPSSSDLTLVSSSVLSDKCGDFNTNQATQERQAIVASPRDTATVRARILSDRTESRSRSRKVSDQKPKGLERCVSEADLTTVKRQRSKSTVGSSSLKSPKSSVRRKSSSGGNLQRASSTSSLNIKSDDQTNQKQRDEPTRLYIRGRSLNLYPPSDFVEDKSVGLPPDQKLQLEWVYGYRGRDCRDNLFYLPSGELVYNIAAVVILYNQETGQQRHYLGHNDDVKCIALHPNKLYIASGQVAGHDKEEGRPHVRVWDSVTLETLQVLGIGQFERAISCLTFTIKDVGRHLVVVDESNEHAISYWDWQNNNMLTENKGSSDPVLMTISHPEDPAIIVSCGKSHIAFWTVLESGGLMKKMGVYGKFDKPRFVLCMCFLCDGNLLTGDSNGNIFEWPQGTNHINKAIHSAHEGPVFSLCSLDNGGFMSGGGRDRLVVLWSETYQPLKEICLPEIAGPVRTIARGVANDDGDFQIAVGTTKNTLLAGTFDQGLTFIATGHTDELWGLAVHPTRRIFVTSGYDKQIILSSADNHTVIWRKQLEESLQSAAFHPKAFVLAVGTQSGNWMVLDSITGDQLGAFHDGPEQLDAIKYSPDGNYIAVGSHDNFIYLYTVSEDGRTYRRHGKLSGHSSFVTHLDWSSDSQYLQSNSGDYEILYWHANRCKQVVSAYSMRDIKWDTWTCVLGFPACGIWPEGADGTDINACCRSTSSEFMVTGDDFGQVNFFRYPVTKLKSDCANCLGHSSHVTCVRFTCDDTRVISTGGKDCSVMQWKII